MIIKTKKVLGIRLIKIIKRAWLSGQGMGLSRGGRAIRMIITRRRGSSKPGIIGVRIRWKCIILMLRTFMSPKRT